MLPETSKTSKGKKRTFDGAFSTKIPNDRFSTEHRIAVSSRNIDTEKTAVENGLEETIKRQTIRMFEIREFLQKNCNKADFQKILSKNGTGKVDDLDELLDRVVDYLTFGATAKCRKCMKGDMIFNKYGYTCNGVDEWAACAHFVKNPPRSKCRIPLYLIKNKTSFFVDYKSPVEDRAVRPGNPYIVKNQEEIYERPELIFNETVTMILKNGYVIDPESGLEDIAHVYCKDGVAYTCEMSLVSFQENKNSRYKIDLLESDIGVSPTHVFWVFQKWGRTGTKIGSKELKKFSSFESACASFESLFNEKTGNIWKEGFPFKKRPNKYFPLEVEYNLQNLKKMSENSNIPTKLKPQHRELVNMLFDTVNMKRTVLEIELDLEKMPLGHLRKKRYQDAYQVLNDLNDLVIIGANKDDFISLSNKFFTLVPQNFGMNRVPLIDTTEKIQNMVEIVNKLYEIEINYSMVQERKRDKMNPLDAHFKQLNTDLQTLDHESEDFKVLSQYVKNTHASSHDKYSLEIIEVFAVERQREKRRFEPFKKLHNRQLLWHGSNMTNFVGILSQGLKIAPPEALVTGHMFGIGIYFSDIVSKSANYCNTSKDQNVGLMLLCEVALGDMHELTEANDEIEKPPTGKHSVKGVGKSFPNDAQAYFRDDGVKIPLGTLETDSNISSELLYNEYIVYDEAQINIQYLLKLKFHYRE